MICRIQVVVIAEDGSQDIRETQSIERKHVTPETLGLTLAEGKAMLKDIQQIVVQQQLSSGLAPCRPCPSCGQSRRSKGYHDLSLRTVFGHLTVKSPRLRGVNATAGRMPPRRSARWRSCCRTTRRRPNCCSWRPNGRR